MLLPKVYSRPSSSDVSSEPVQKTNKIAQYAAFITFIICKCRKPNAILAYFYFVKTYSLGDMI